MMRNLKKCAVLGLTAAAVGFAGVPSAAAEIYGLVVGIDDYQYVNKLDGAVNDAKDIAQALRKIGAKAVVVLTNDKATRDNVEGAWKSLASVAEPGDTIVLSYAGHGVAGRDTAGKPGQFVALAGFQFRGRGTYERILDREFGAWMRSVPKVNVVFVVDSCHAGTMTRGWSKENFGKQPFKIRALSSQPIEDDQLTDKIRDIPADAVDDGVALPNVAHLGAVHADEVDPEVIIDNQPRGALSYAFSRALEGNANNHAATLKGGQLASYVASVVAQRTDGQQHPVIGVRDAWSLALKRDSLLPAQVVDLDNPPKQPTQVAAVPPPVQPVQPKVSQPPIQPVAVATQLPPPAPPAPVAEPSVYERRPVTLAIINPPGGDAAAIAAQLKGVKLESVDIAEIAWNAATGEVASHLGDVVAYGKDVTRAYQRVSVTAAASAANLDLPRIQHIVDKYAIVDAIKADVARHALTMALLPDDRLHYEGTQVTFTVSDHSLTYLTLFNLASDGTINYLYPLVDGANKDPLQIPAGRKYELPLKVQPPFGADHLVAITSREPLNELHRRLAALDGKPASEQLVEIMSGALTGKTYQIGIYGSFTAPK